jgi:hypothetical protein
MSDINDGAIIIIESTMELLSSSNLVCIFLGSFSIELRVSMTGWHSILFELTRIGADFDDPFSGFGLEFYFLLDKFCCSGF